MSLVVPQNVSMLSVLPHSHLLAKKWKIWAILPTGDTLKIVKTYSWNFRWQGNYRFPLRQKLPAGARLEADVTYDNTAANPRNPNSPPQQVNWGENTSDEMLVSYCDLLPYQAGDGALLRWSTASELRSSCFAIKSSVSGATFQRLGQVASAGSSAQLRSYQFADANLVRYAAA